jgi:hypothetical protein
VILGALGHLQLSVKFVAVEVAQISTELVGVASKLVDEGWQVHAFMAWALAEVDLFAKVVVLMPGVAAKVLVFVVAVTLVDLVSKLTGELILVLVSELIEIKALSVVVAVAVKELV